MDMMKLKNKEEAGQDNHFDRLPEDLLLSIISRMDDLKFLCQCSLVSKRFASTIYRIRGVSLTLPSIEIHSTNKSAENIRQLFPQILDLSVEEITRLIQSSSIQELKFSLFLQNFRELKSISLEFTCPGSLSSSSLLKWKAKCRSSGAMVERIVSLLATSVRKMTEYEFDEEQEDQETLSESSLSRIKGGVLLPLRCCREWLFVLCLLIKCQHSLQSVTITNSEKQGMFVLRDEQLVEWRKNLLCGGFLKNFMPKTFRTCFVPELHLPLSGYRMRGVYFTLMGFPLETDSITESDDAMTWEYEGEDKLLGEAVREILTNHRDVLITVRVNQLYYSVLRHSQVF